MSNPNNFGPNIAIINEDGGVSPLQLGANLANLDASKSSSSAITALQNRNINTTSPLTGGGNLTSDRTLSISGFSGTITTAKLTGPGANGSMTFTDGVLTAQTPAT